MTRIVLTAALASALAVVATQAACYVAADVSCRNRGGVLERGRDVWHPVCVGGIRP